MFIALLLPWITLVSISGRAGINAFGLTGGRAEALLASFGAEWFGIWLWIMPGLALASAGLALADRFGSLKWLPSAAAALTGLVIVSLTGYAFFTVLVLRQIGALSCGISGLLFLAGALCMLGAPWSPPTVRQDRKRISIRELPWATIAIVALNVAVHLITAWRADRQELIRELGLIGGSIRLHALATHLFIHADVFHLTINMLVLLAVGWVLERRVGWLVFAVVYLVGGATGSLIAAFVDPRIFAAMIGASGAVFSVMGLCIVVAPWARLRIWLYIFVTAGRIEVPAAWAFAVAAALQATGALRLAFGTAGPVGYWAHLGGMALGLAAGGLLRAIKRSGHTPVGGDAASSSEACPESDSTQQATGREPRSRSIVLPYSVIGVSFALSLGAAVLTFTSGSLLGVLSGFQRAWNSGQLERVESYFNEPSKAMLSRQFRRLMTRVEGAGTDAGGKTEFKISLTSIRLQKTTCRAKYLCAPRGKDPYRSPKAEVGRLEVRFSRERGGWRVRGMRLWGMETQAAAREDDPD
jgi:membrane associated rhomboid family serine protease